MLQIRPIKDREIDQAIALLLRPGSSEPPSAADKAGAFKNLAQQENYDLTRQIVVWDNKLLFTALLVVGRGGAGFIFMSSPFGLAQENRENCSEAMRQLMRWAADLGCNLLQILTETGDTDRKDVCMAAGFEYMTDLIYLYRFSDFQIPPCRELSAVSWVTYDSAQHKLFKQVIGETYHDSLDCPELSAIRTLDETIESHKAAGRFEPALWKLLLQNGQPTGVIILSPMKTGNTTELTYMGICRAARGKGTSNYLLHNALATLAKTQTKTLTLAVDTRNKPAIRLYRKFNFKEIFQRSVMYHSTRW